MGFEPADMRTASGTEYQRESREDESVNEQKLVNGECFLGGSKRKGRGLNLCEEVLRVHWDRTKI